MPMRYLTDLGAAAKAAAAKLALLREGEKNAALRAMAAALRENRDTVLTANEHDLAEAREHSMSEAMIDRLRLTPARIEGIADSLEEVTVLPDPVGAVLGGGVRPNGLCVTKIAVPFGVVGVIFESRPNVTVDCAALCLKSGNACILRGGKEAIHSNAILVGVMQRALAGCGLPREAVQLVARTDRETAVEMMKLGGYIDVLIPRGGAGLIRSVVDNASVPVIETGIGNCHAFVDESADLELAARIVDNAKTSRPSVCNALETLLVHRGCAERFLPMVRRLLDGHGVELRGCPETVRILGGGVKPAGEEDYACEFLDYILAVKVVEGLDEAIGHIARYSTHHSEAILTRDLDNSRRFVREVDSAAVYVNASTRFTDGGEFGLGAEIGVSTQKLHARGPMGLRELVSYKYVIEGDGQVR